MNMAEWAALAEQNLYVNVFEDCITKASERGVTPQREVQGGETNRGLPLQSC